MSGINKMGTGKLREILKRLYERCINKEYTSEGRRASCITPIQKKSSQRDSKNCSRIAVVSNVDRIYTKVMRNLIEKEIVTKQAEEQSGFMIERFTTDSIFALNMQ
jgi:hypothetical protein